MMSYLGREIARRAMGSQDRPCAFDTGSFPERSWYAGWAWFVPPLTALYDVLDGYDRWTK